MVNGPLNNVRILDLTHVWAGPLATRILADLGAQVLKVEPPMGRGPREYPAPPFGGFVGKDDVVSEPWNANATFVKLMRNKKSLAMDLKTEAGRSAFLKLVKVSDVVIENFSARAMKDLKLDYPHLKEANETIIHVAMPGYGLDGPYSDRVAFGPTVEPMSGLHSVMGYSADEPRATAMALPDATSAVSATAAVLTALRIRQKIGQGQQVEMSLHESAVAHSGPWLIETQLHGQPDRIGNRHPEMSPHGVYKLDGEDHWVAIGCPSDLAWRTLCHVIPLPYPDSLPLELRLQNEADIDHVMNSWTSNKTYEEVQETFHGSAVAVGKVMNTAEMLENPQSVRRGYFVPLESGTPMPGNPIKMRNISPDDWTPCPKLGEHNEDVLRDWLGYDSAKIQALASQGVIVDKPPR